MSASNRCAAAEIPLIEGVHAREVLDSRGNPTVAVTVATSFGAVEEAMVPSGASTGAERSRRAARRRPSDAIAARACAKPSTPSTRCSARRSKASTRPRSAKSTRKLIELDGTPNKSNLGANAILGVSLAVARAAAVSLSLPLFRYLGGPSARRFPFR